MPIFDSFKHGVDITKFKADQLLRVNRVQSEINVLNQNAVQIQHKIATKAMELHYAGNLTIAELELLCQSIDEIKAQISNKEAQITAIKAEDLPTLESTIDKQALYPCPACGFQMPITADFCPNCGRGIDQRNIPKPENETNKQVTCRNCGVISSAAAVFCTGCGNKL